MLEAPPNTVDLATQHIVWIVVTFPAAWRVALRSTTPMMRQSQLTKVLIWQPANFSMT